jgi:endonuclease III
VAGKQRQGTVAALLDRYGCTYAQEAGITLADRPSPLYQLLVLSTLLSARITASVAISAARELFAAGYRTPEAMLKASWQARVNALGRGHYRRYDERSATMLGDGARLCQQRWGGDLRRLRDAAHGDLRQMRRLLIEFSGIGPTGAAIFLREVQGVWTGVAPFADAKVSAGAKAIGLPTSGEGLASLVPAAEFPRLASALVRVALAGNAAEELRAAR